MGSHADSGHTDERSKRRPTITRRSCDQCRARKVGCDRGSPCSNCISTKLSCTHSAVASSSAAPKQRVLISAQYEQKIDDIANRIDGITLLLQGLNMPSDKKQLEAGHIWHPNQAGLVKPVNEHHPICASGGEHQWDHPVDIIDFVKALVDDRGSRDIGPEADELLSSLRNLVQTLERPAAIWNVPFLQTMVATSQANPPMPPLEAVVEILRWAKNHEAYGRITWISQILPLQKFTVICRKVYFAIDDYSEVDLILANAYLSYIFSEHVIVSGRQDYREYCCLCRGNLDSALSRLPLLLPASMEVIAVLTLGAFNAIENCKATVAWTFISVASNLCQTLGYHRLHTSREIDQPLRAAQENLFWAVYTFDKGLSLRLGRPPNIRDAEITLPFDPHGPRYTRSARIHGKVYDELYSPTGLSRPDNERFHIAKLLAGEVRELINEAHVELSSNTGQPGEGESDPMRPIYLQCDLVCFSSLLALILRAIPTSGDSLSCVSDDCVAVARDALDIHQQCMIGIRGFKNDSFIVTKYLNWGILYSPFVPFSILFTRAVQLWDIADLARLDRFAASLRPRDASPDIESSITHPFRLYQLLCQAIQLYIDLNIPSSTLINNSTTDSLGDEFDFAQYDMEAGATANETSEAGLGDTQTYALSDWYYGNQRLMNLLAEDAMF